jgi:hypothetical protein
VMVWGAGFLRFLSPDESDICGERGSG